MPTNSQVTGQMMPSSETEMQQQVVGNQDRLKISSTIQKQPQVAKYETMPGQQGVMGQDHLELVGVESPKLKMRQAKSHHSQPAPPQTLQVAQQAAILPQSGPQSTNYYAPEYIRQSSLPTHRSASQATAKNHVSTTLLAFFSGLNENESFFCVSGCNSQSSSISATICIK